MMYVIANQKENKFMIEIPNKEEYDIIKQDVCDGRVCCYQKN